MKIGISLLGGLVIGFVLSYFFLDYNGWTLEYIGEKGETNKVIHELDFDLITNGFLIMLGFSLLIYVTWTLIEKKKG